ncbi:MAG: FAD:protein FMN transferase [Candidatus Undinarchaeales archaeon]|nr:FAD:protein FMN transferase [Candidatus Undinarchaeales archaeon]
MDDRRIPVAITLVLMLLLAGCQQPPGEVVRNESLMGTLVTIKVVHADEQAANASIERAYAEMRRIEEQLTNKVPESEVSRLNVQGEMKPASPELIQVLQLAVEHGELSGGAFDVTVQPLLDLYTHSFRDLKRPPTEEEINTTLEQVDYRRIELHDGWTALPANMSITLGGIAKGYIIDVAFRVLRADGIENVLINAGGDIRAFGRNVKGNPWTLALQNPREATEYITRVRAADAGVATSGDYERYYDPEKKFHHIVDPTTGYSALGLISVTVIADETVRADALATSVFVMGKEKGLALVESLEGVEALVITEEREVFRSSGFAALELP